MKVSIEQQYLVRGEAFGARGCSGCTCDPCDCNPCNCGDGVAIPRWRVSGYAPSHGSVEAFDVSGLFILSLAQPRVEGGVWQEVLLVDNKASVKQIAALLIAFESRLESMPAEIASSSHRRQRSVYMVPMQYRKNERGGWLEVNHASEVSIPVREDVDSLLITWRYAGPMASRGRFHFSS
ncbi:hypothetical protein [Ktedonospora formicarum]|uniref:DUF1326 domain-containing protein n=1 Tax=Ktedonospora formicarum TaxID=2778364 RepID=A0A8J3HWU8_9CHLR|nr:hypothetical protein [Ktedonospora formicarum]GHO42495.1 hypothetical protein KSX_06580 [Ktedonospora formicarum]